MTETTRRPLKAPFTVCLWVTDHCNLACKYCYAMPFSGRRMDSERVLELVDEFIEIGVFDITLAGGEPTLHPEIATIAGKAIAAGMRVGLLTNAVALSDKLLSTLDTNTDKSNFIVQVSIDSFQLETNDTTRGKTERVLRNIDRLIETNIDLQLACVVSKNNIDTAHLLIEKYYPKIKRFHFLNIQRTASALKHPELLLDEQDALRFWLNLNEYSKKFPSDLFLPSLRIQMRSLGDANIDPHASLHQEATFDCGVCSAGWTHVNVNSDFDVLGCDIAKEHSFMGNCKNESFSEVWFSEQADKIRNMKIPACYKIKAPDGTSLMDDLKSEYRQYAN